ncbi:hypothetical protein EOS_17865 [Caballeronia mineralivorans PML1(12)]|uniref:General secretion pathway protein GspM n=1 Tax=Caballeronia mineralivorans PML1(12) TaxID=908627 RepID=A0A0J1CWB1_9BURK|nr:type II secretion system protein M [Caballeronia mineralivorans]KLU24865.1 hypothetical protein EOS_17865 [Caballeronia mineralivorans PML1(12)]
MDSQAHAIKAALTEWFEARAPREKKLLAGGGALVIAALVYNVLWAPAYDGRAKIAANLPQLEVQLAEVQVQADEARALKAVAAVRAPAGVALRDTLATSLSQAGIAQAQLAVLGKGVQVDVKNAPFGAWMSWLDQVRREDHVRVVNAQVTGEEKLGLATVSVTLEPASDQ